MRARLLLVFLVACGVDVPRATELDVRRAAQARPGTTLAELQAGRSAYLAKCTTCHRPVAPRSIAPEKWPHYVDEMAERSHLTPEARASILLYLTTIAAPAEPAAAK